jgi:hypothetical protein
MKNIPLVSLFYRPHGMGEFASKQSEFAAVVVKAVSGMIVVLPSVLMSQLFTIPLIVSHL